MTFLVNHLDLAFATDLGVHTQEMGRLMIQDDRDDACCPVAAPSVLD